MEEAGSRVLGAGSWEQVTGSRERVTGSRLQGAGYREQGAGSRVLGVGGDTTKGTRDSSYSPRRVVLRAGARQTGNAARSR